MNPIEGVAAVITPNLKCELTLTKLHRLPQIVVENAERGNLHDLPQIFRIWSRYALPTLGIFDIGAAVPLDPPDIKAVVQNACASIGLTSDGGIPPLAPIRT
jgi:hypothetical protein